MMISESTKARLGYLGTMEGKNMYAIAQRDPEAIISFYKDNEADDKKDIPLNNAFFKVNVDVHSYYFFSRTNGVDIFVELPLVEDDDVFSWEDKRFGRRAVLWAKLKKGFLRFNCSYWMETKDASINIYWEREQIGHLMIKDATNEEILKAINEWATSFEGHVVHSVTMDKFVKAT